MIDANVNFGASKLTVYGETTIQKLEEAGAFEGIKLIPEKEKVEFVKVPFYKKNWNVLLACVFLLAGWLIQSNYGEGYIGSVIPYALSIIIGGFNLFKTGIQNLFRLQFDMRTLMTIAIIGAALIGEWGEGATVVILFAISEVLEAYSMDKARASIGTLMNIAPKEAQIKRYGREMFIPVEDILIGDIMIVKPGQKIAMDGTVLTGTSTVDQAPITGESIPVNKSIGDEVFAGTLNVEGLLEITVTKTIEDTTLAKIIHLVEEAQGERAPSQAFVDKFAKYYTPVIILIAFLVAIIPPLLFNGNWDKWIYQGLAVLVVGCPCALVISTPVSIVTAIGNAARNGVLIKGGIHLEEAGALRAIAFDKTGTLTKGIPAVTEILTYHHAGKGELLRVAAALEKGSQHPLAKAIMNRADQEEISYKSIEVFDFTSITGKGIKGQIDEVNYLLGSPRLFDGHPDIKSVSADISRLENEGKTVVILGNEDTMIGIAAISDEIRESSRGVIRKLHELGIEETIMLTGDNHGTANAVAEHIGVKSIAAQLLPEDKLTYIHELRSKYVNVAMVGDGVNDAPALAAATVGIAMGGAGTDTALETADIALMSDDLTKLPFTIKLSRKALTIIKQNIIFSIGIKLLALMLVVPGWLTLWIAIFADMGATLIVTLNGLRLLRVKGTK